MAATALLLNALQPLALSSTGTMSRQRLVDRLVLAAVLVGAVAAAGFVFQQYFDVARFRWSSPAADRNAHYLLGLSLARDVQQGDLKQLLSDLDGARTWPPLHGLLAALVLLVGGLDYRLAVLPSLAGWVGTVVFGFLVARRMTPRGGNLAGLTAVAFILVSPAHRVFATDVMLESLGACLSLLVLYLYLVAKQNPTPWIQRGLGLALTALFFTKYNYWLLVAATLVATEISAQPGGIWQSVRQMWAGIDWRRWLRAQARHPLTYLLAAILVLLALVVGGGGTSLPFQGKSISLHSPHNLLHLAYIVLFIRMVWWWRRAGRVWGEQLDVRLRQLLFWHGLPIAVWFLWPKRLGYWLWYVTANQGENPRHDLEEAIAYYASRSVIDYHLGLWSALLAAGLLAVTVLSWRRLRPGGRAVLFLVLISTLATVPHPNRKSRFLHSWIAAGWVAAGTGLALLSHGRLAARLGRARPLLAGAAVCGLGLAHFPGLTLPGHSPERGHDDYLAASTRDLTDAYLPWLDDSRRTLLLSTMEIKHLLRWSFLERHRQRDRMEVDLKGLGASAEENRRCFERWLATTACDTIVFVEVPPGSFFYELTNHNEAFTAHLPGLLASQSVFQLVERRTFTRYGCNVALYRRGGQAAARELGPTFRVTALTRHRPETPPPGFPQTGRHSERARLNRTGE